MGINNNTTIRLFENFKCFGIVDHCLELGAILDEGQFIIFASLGITYLVHDTILQV